MFWARRDTLHAAVGTGDSGKASDYNLLDIRQISILFPNNPIILLNLREVESAMPFPPPLHSSTLPTTMSPPLAL
jgi:hypothetical protein